MRTRNLKLTLIASVLAAAASAACSAEPSATTPTPTATPTGTTDVGTATTPIPPPTATETVEVEGPPGPKGGVLSLEETADGFVIQEYLTLRIWHLDEQGWEKRGKATNFNVEFSPDGQVGHVLDQQTFPASTLVVSPDGGRTWGELRVPPTACKGRAAILDSGIYLGTGACAPGETEPYWQDRGSSKWQPRPLLEGAYVVRLGDRLVALTNAEGTDRLSRVQVSSDTGRTWQELTSPCRAWGNFAPGEYAGTVFKACTTGGTTTMFTLRDDLSWEPAVTLPARASTATPLGNDRWLATTRSGEVFLVTSERSTLLEVPWDANAGWLDGVARLGTDIHLTWSLESTVRSALYVSHDGGLTWQKEA